MSSKRFVSFFALLLLIVSIIEPLDNGLALNEQQVTTPERQIQTILSNMTSEEKVGQLFLITFNGSSVDETSQIYDLITNYNIGGVVLLNTNDNFSAEPDTIINTQKLISDLQTIEMQKSKVFRVNETTNTFLPGNFLPLFIGISQAGDGYPNDQIINGLTPLPSQMAIGATWQPILSNKVGQVAGYELSQLGFNLFLGPSLDVLMTSGTVGGGGLGVRSFGGDPYWVAEMGKEFINGMHEGSNGRIAIIAENFPGKGSSDRSSTEEVATVRKSLESLKQIELAPFFEVTKNDPGTITITDGLLLSHIRYQGFQGNIRATTRPVSLDPQALSQILALVPLSTWREKGGLIVSDDLGLTAVRKFYDPANQSFSARIVARDAFLAGNDLLYLGNIISSDAIDNYASIVQIYDFFRQKYNDDAAFAQRVDESVTRILSLKFRLYGDFSLNKVIPSSDLSKLGTAQDVTFEIARQAATLISPDAIDLDSLVPLPPGYRDRLLFITDTRVSKQCSTCPELMSLGKNSLPDAILRLYGPQAGGLIGQNSLAMYSFEDLNKILLNGEGDPTLEDDLSSATWVIISIQDLLANTNILDSLRRLFSERQATLQNKKIILFAFNAPYFLDATDISKLTVYYGLFSKSQPFIDVAARLLFHELTPIGSLPVSVSGVGYDLLSATAPNPNQVIDLSLDLPTNPVNTQAVTPEVTVTPYFKVGDTISVRTGVILDNNNRPVPDGTGVRFTLTSNIEGNILQVVDVVTFQGVARTSFGINQPGLIEIRATCDPSVSSVVLQLDITNEGISVTVVPPTQAIMTGTPVTLETPIPTEEASLPSSSGYPGISGWFILVLLVGGIGALAISIGNRFVSLRWGIRWFFCISLSSLVAYNFLIIGFPGTRAWIQTSGMLAVIELTILSTLLGWGCGLVWTWLSMKQRSDQTDQ
jgi:beta-N-acetylhexosaminidase